MATWSSNTYTNLIATPKVLADSVEINGKSRSLVESVSVTSGGSNGDVVVFFPVWSGWRLNDLQYMADDLEVGSTTLDVNFGLYDVTDGTDFTLGSVVDDNIYGDAVSFTSTVLTPTSFTRTTGGARDLNAEGNKIWEDAAATADPHKWYLICATIITSGDATGDITCKADVIVE
jgi:hypothetical protein